MQPLQLQTLEPINLTAEPLSPPRFESARKTPSTGSFEEILSSLQRQMQQDKNEIERSSQSPNSNSKEQEISKTEVSSAKDKKENAKDVNKTENEVNKKMISKSDADDKEIENQDSEKAALENSIYLIGKIENVGKEVAPNIEESENIEIETETSLTEKNLSWLFKKENVASNDDLEALIEDAMEITESESDILERLQNLSTSDPELFLSKAEKFASENENFAANLNIDNLKNAFDASKDKKATSPATKITVRDYRTTKGDGENKNADSIVKSAAKNQKNQLDFNLNQNETAKNQVTFELNARNDATQNILAANNQAAGANGSTFETMLSQSIQTNAPDFVKAGTVVLKDEGKGSINLILHPESLGNVKVNLSLNDKTLSGVITVQSQEAFNAFKENLETLKNAFAQNGFENVDFNLNFSNGNEANQGFAQGQNDEAASRERAKFAYGEYISLNPTEDFTENYITDGSYAVNLVA